MSTILSLNLSSEAIMQEIYATSALRCVLNNGDNHRTGLLNRDRVGALRLLVKDAFAHVVMLMIRYVEGTNLNNETEADAVVEQPYDAGDVILQVDVRVPDVPVDGLAGTLRHYVEHAVAMYALHLCYMGDDASLSRHHERLANESVEKIIKMLGAAILPNQGVTPHYF